MQPLPSISRRQQQEDQLNKYLHENNIEITDNDVMTPINRARTEQEEKKHLDYLIKQHKIYERLGFGYLALFNTM